MQLDHNTIFKQGAGRCRFKQAFRARVPLSCWRAGRRQDSSACLPRPFSHPPSVQETLVRTSAASPRQRQSSCRYSVYAVFNPLLHDIQASGQNGPEHKDLRVEVLLFLGPGFCTGNQSTGSLGSRAYARPGRGTWVWFSCLDGFHHVLEGSTGSPKR